MQKLQLNTEKITAELRRIGKNKAWLARQMNTTPAMATYVFREKPITFADKIAAILNIDSKDLII